MKLSKKIDFLIHQLFSLIFLFMFIGSIYLLFSIDRELLLNKVPIVLFLILELLFSSGMQLVNYYIYLKGYDIKVKEYIDIYLKGRAIVKINTIYRDIPFTRSEGKNYLYFIYLLLFSKKKIESIHKAPNSIKYTMLLFNILVALQLIILFIIFILIIFMIL